MVPRPQPAANLVVRPGQRVGGPPGQRPAAIPGERELESLRPGAIGIHTRAVGLDLREEDRKSTRLNSSHSQISYAVFCLKKKNKRQNTAHSQISYAVFCLKKKSKGFREK